MPKASFPQTPTRRSQRFQPTATPVKSINNKAILECVWASEPIYVRPSNSEIDLLPEEQEKANDDDDDEVHEKEALETFFYHAFTMKRKVASLSGGRHGIVKLAQRTYHVGDTVLIETDSIYLMRRPPSVGVIVAMWQIKRNAQEPDDPNKMRVRIHWFLRPTEMASIRAKRHHEENEIYYSLSTTAIVAPGAILSPCAVSSNLQPTTVKSKPRVFVPVTPSKKRKGQKDMKSSPAAEEHEDTSDDGRDEGTEEPDARFYCRLAVDSRRGLFYKFAWERHRKDALSKAQLNNSGPSSTAHPDHKWALGNLWIVEEVSRVSSTTKKGRHVKIRRVKNENVIEEEEFSNTEIDESDSESDSDDKGVDANTSSEGEDSEDDTMVEPRTPSRKRKREKEKTPGNLKRNKNLVQPTPHSKAALAMRQKTTTSPRKRKVEPSFGISFSSQSLTFKTSMAHLPKDPWLRAMHALHVGSRPGSLPCREEEFNKVLRCISELLDEGSGGCIYISGVPGTGKTATVHTVIKELKRMAENNEINPFSYVEINGLKVAEPAAAYNLLWEGVSGHDVEKDGHLHIGAKESLKALTRHFASGNRGPGGHACVVLMDELDQLVTPKQDVVYNFFNWPTLLGSKLVVIAVANTMDLPERVMTGRVRSRLGMVRINFQPYSREQLEKIVEARLASAKEEIEDDKTPSQVIVAADAIKLAAMTVSRITGDARRVLDICRRAVELVQATRGTVKAPHIREVVQLMQNSPTAAFLRHLSFHERLMLASLVSCAKREGVDEIKWSEVQYQHLNFIHSLSSEDDSTRRPTSAELLLVLDSLVSSRAVVVQEGVLVARKPDGERRLLLNIELSEVLRVLSDTGGQRWKNLLMSD